MDEETLRNNERVAVISACDALIRRTEQLKKFYNLEKFAPFVIIANQTRLMDEALQQIKELTDTTPEGLERRKHERSSSSNLSAR